MQPEARRWGLWGWYLTVHGVRGCPERVCRTRLVWKQMSLTVWSPWVEAKEWPSGEKQVAIVDLVERGRGV
jgi:hypothetical protein